MEKVRVTVWNEFVHEREDEGIRRIYPEGIHGCIAGFLSAAGFEAGVATLDMPSHGLTHAVLSQTDVLIWWGHLAHDQVEDEVVDRVYERVMEGMGLIVLHSGHASKIFSRLCGTRSQLLRWRESGDTEILWVLEPSHPITAGIDGKIIIPAEETYGERFEIPQPDDLLFVSWFSGGEVFRSGLCYRRGNGKVFYFRPGHESFPVYHMPEIQRVITNAVCWAAPSGFVSTDYGDRGGLMDPVIRQQTAEGLSKGEDSLSP